MMNLFLSNKNTDSGVNRLRNRDKWKKNYRVRFSMSWSNVLLINLHAECNKMRLRLTNQGRLTLKKMTLKSLNPDSFHNLNCTSAYSRFTKMSIMPTKILNLIFQFWFRKLASSKQQRICKKKVFKNSGNSTIILKLNKNLKYNYCKRKPTVSGQLITRKNQRFKKSRRL